MKRSETRNPLATTQEKARDLLLRTAGLREAKFPASNDDANAKKSADAKSNENFLGGVVTPTRDFGTDPWKDVEKNPKLDTAMGEELPAPVVKP